jgi:hypothetical protein
MAMQQGRAAICRTGGGMFGTALLILATVAPAANCLHSLQRAATQADVAHSPAWRALVRQADPASMGLVVGEEHSFLLAKGRTAPGQTAAATELTALLAALVAECGAPAPALPPTPTPLSVQCRFPARYALLRELLPVDACVPVQPCPEHEAWLAQLQPSGTQKLSLVFAAASLDSPLTAFGHAFVVPQAGPAKAQLLAPGIGFTVQAPRSLGAVLSEGLRGSFVVQPYWQLLTTYGRRKMRDVWQFELQLSDGQRRRLLQHLWELQRGAWRYGVMRNNCASQLLLWLHTALPKSALPAKLDLFFTPIDLVHWVGDQPQLIVQTLLRPAATSGVAQRLPRAPQSSTSAPQTLPAASDPRLGHASSHLSLGPGVRIPFHAAASPYLRLEMRPALHDNLEAPVGYPEGATLELMAFTLRLGLPKSGLLLQLERFDLLHVAALRPAPQSFAALAWRLALGHSGRIGPVGRLAEAGAVGAVGGLGASVALHRRVTGYVLLSGQLGATLAGADGRGAGAGVGGAPTAAAGSSRAATAVAGASPLALRAWGGLHAGLQAQPSPRLRLLVEAQSGLAVGPADAAASLWGAQASAHLKVFRQWAVRASCTASPGGAEAALWGQASF